MTRQDIKRLLQDYSSGTCTEEEKVLLESWYSQYKGADLELSDAELEIIKASSWQKITGSKRSGKNSFSWISYAAAIFVFGFFFLGLLFYFDKSNQTEFSRQEILVKNDLTPGGNRATLTLADGRIVALDKSSNGLIAESERMKVNKTADGLIVYNLTKSSQSKGKSPRYNVITTPRGGQFQIILSDGTKVWLNAASTLRYPENFESDRRNVELLGEAYFEVSNQKSDLGKTTPFLVHTALQTVEVLGTHFNINSYQDEGVEKTSLLEGSVKVTINSSESKKAVVLKPNQQSTLNGLTLDVSAIDSDEIVAWKNGYFSFEGANIEEVMRQLSRWYDVDIVYEGNIPEGKFTGKVYRNMNLSKVLDILYYAKVNFRIEGKKMFIFS